MHSNFHRGRFRSAKKLANQKSENQPDLRTEKGSQTELDNQTALEPQNIPQHTLFVFEFSTTNYTRKGFIGHIQEIIIRSAFLWSWGGELRNIVSFNLFACPYGGHFRYLVILVTSAWTDQLWTDPPWTLLRDRPDPLWTDPLWTPGPAGDGPAMDPKSTKITRSVPKSQKSPDPSQNHKNTATPQFLRLIRQKKRDKHEKAQMSTKT